MCLPFLLFRGLKFAKMNSINFASCLLGRNLRIPLNVRLLSQNQQVAVESAIATKPVPKAEEKSPLYPPVKPRYPPGMWGRMTDKNAWKWHEKGVEVLKAATLPERLEVLAGTEKKGYWKANPFLKRRHALAGAQYMTKTRVKHSLPESYSQLGSKVNETTIKTIETLIKELFAQDDAVKQNESNCFDDLEERDAQTRLAFMRQLITFMCSLSSSENPAIGRCQVSERASVETAWQRWGYKYPDVRTTTKDQGGIRVQSAFNPDFLIRTERPMVPVLKTIDDVMTEQDAGPIPEFTYAPSNLGMRGDTIKPTWLPGFKPGDPCEFGALQVIDITTFLSGAESELNFGKQPHIVQELLDACAVMAGFTWASALAHYQGFSMYHDLTYPFCVQTVLTDTRRFVFSTYQLNTLSLFKDGQSPNGNLRENACWTTSLMPLENSASKTTSPDVIRHLLSFFRYPTDARSTKLDKLRPYFSDYLSPLASNEPLIKTKTPVPTPVPVVDEFWKV